MKTVLVEKLCCTVRGCNRPQQGRGLCITHYMRLWRGGLINKIADPGTNRIGGEVVSTSDRAPRSG